MDVKGSVFLAGGTLTKRFFISSFSIMVHTPPADLYAEPL